jgi:hypothetical protein
MSWHEQFREEIEHQGYQKVPASYGQIPVQCIADIPREATSKDTFSLPVEVVQVYERITQGGDPCFFLHCRDSRDVRFSVVVWNWQWEEFQGEITVGKRKTFEVRVPKEGFKAFTLA